MDKLVSLIFSSKKWIVHWICFIPDAFVAGGTENYEKAFLTPEYLEEHPEDGDKVDKLTHAICYQIPLLELGLK